MNTFLFITAFIISVLISLVFIHEIKHKNTKKTSAFIVNVRNVARGVTVFMLSIALADKFGLIDFGAYSGTYFLMGICCTAEFILCEINKKHSTAVISFAVKTILTALVLELVLFNISSYRTWFGDYPQLKYDASQLILDRGGEFNESENAIYVYNGEELVVRIMNVGHQVNTVYLDMKLDSGRSANVVLDASDETQSYTTRWDVANSLISRERDQTHYIQCELSGNVGELAVKLKPVYSGSAHIKSITLNKPIPFEISWVRFLFIVLISIFIYAVAKGTFMNKSITENRRFCRIFTVCVTVFACIWAVYTIHYHFDGKTFKDQMKQTSGSQVSQQLVDAFEDGRTYLYPEPEEVFETFDNPYDRQHREAKLVPQLESEYYNTTWDHVYYNGKFYSYYGIAPVILLFLPYHVLTGYYFPHSVAVLIFSLIGIVGLSAFFCKFTKKFFPSLPTGMFIASLIIIQMISGIWYSVGRPDFYEVAMSAGFAFMTWAFYFLISANIIGKEKVSLIKTAVASLLFAIAVLCRPTTVLYCICSAIFMLCAVPKFSDNGKKKIFNKKSITYLACAILPMVCLGLVQMIYNYARFDSPFEFGIQYSLTINDFRKAQFHWRLSLIPLFNYLFNTPTFTPEYPFIAGNFQNMNVGGFFYNDCDSTHSVCGLFFLALPMFAYAFSGQALKTLPDRKEKLKKSLYIAFPCVIIPLIIICSVWESGYAIRYMTDFAWQMLTGAYIIIFCIYMKSQNPTIKKMINILLCISLAWTIVVGGVQIFNQEFRYVNAHYDYPEMVYELEKIFMFWK